jgi:hypothetical protein
VEDGDTLPASIDPDNGFPSIELSIEIDEALSENPLLALDADGLQVLIREIPGASAGEPIPLSWTAWHGNGTYELVVHLLDKDGKSFFSLPLSIQVSDIPEGTPTIAERFIRLYKEKFNLIFSAPVFTHYGVTYEPAEEAENRWISTAYTQDTLYVIQLFDNGTVTHLSKEMYGDNPPYGICRPQGEYKILTIVVDYGNTSLTEEKVRENLEKAVTEANQHWADYSASINLPESILEIENTTAFIDAPADSNDFITLEQVKTFTGYDPMQFDLLAEVSLDSENRVIQTQIGGNSGGISFPNRCEPGSKWNVNMSVNIRNQTIAKHAGQALFEHELMHMMGWNHWWPVGDGSSNPGYSDGFILPHYLYGWADTDGDGIIEINDPTPYGLMP